MNCKNRKTTAGILAAMALAVCFFAFHVLAGEKTSACMNDVPQAKASVQKKKNLSSAAPVSSKPDETVRFTAKPDPAVVKDSEKLKKSIYSPAAILICADDRTVLLEKNAEKKIYPASMTKIMTAIVAIEEAKDLHEKVTLPKPIFDKMYEEDASMAGFVPDEQVTMHDLLYGAILPSGAECCAGLADRLEGSEAGLAAAMNRKAAVLGMTNTHFVNTTGLYDAQHYSTVKDIAAVLYYALKNSTFRSVFTTPRYTTSPTNKHADGISFESTMFRCLKSNQAGKATILGGKVGYTDEAGLCLASLASFNGKEYILVTAGAKNLYRAEIKDAITVYSSLGS
jgi:D-alanyl-D-alanine carboxypeptidase (penicillin-binding protein 5/6)